MKNQYFGDTRDLFKYDLVLRILGCVPALRSFTFIPMLTADDRSSDGSRTDHRRARAAGSQNTSLVRYLEGCIRDGRRDIREILPFFRDRGITVHLHGEGFTHQERAGYFRSIPDPWFRDALVLLDPDVGLEVARPTGKHLLFAEIRDLLGRMTGSSVLMVFQYFPRVNRAAYLENRTGELGKIIPGTPLVLSDNQVAFFFLVKELETGKVVQDILAGYRDDYPSLTLFQ